MREAPSSDRRDEAYDLEPLGETLLEEGVEMIAPHRKKRGKKKTQEDGCKLGRYKGRWMIERLFTWLSDFAGLVARYEYEAEDFLGMVQLGSIVILLRKRL